MKLLNILFQLGITIRLTPAQVESLRKYDKKQQDHITELHALIRDYLHRDLPSNNVLDEMVVRMCGYNDETLQLNHTKAATEVLSTLQYEVSCCTERAPFLKEALKESLKYYPNRDINQKDYS